MIKRKIYQWHRTVSIIIAVPVILWAISGFMHPIMTNIRPKVATQWIMPSVIDSTKINVSLKTALQLNKIDSFSNFRIVHIDTNWFYQIQPIAKKEPYYLSTATGKILHHGDWLYAQYLAKIFLEGQKKDSTYTDTLASRFFNKSAIHDCCNAATECVLQVKSGSKVKDVTYVSEFNKEYNSINRLLPVYKVSFEREDGIRIFVETTQDRFGTAIDNKRYAFTVFFEFFHQMGWLNFLGKGRLVVEIIFTLLTFFTVLMGLYIFFTTKGKKTKGNQIVNARRNHRYTSILIALFTLMFSFSGGYHALSKFKDDIRDNYFVTNHFASAQINLDFHQVQKIIRKPISNISIIQIDTTIYWQVTTKNSFTKKTKVEGAKGKDLMKDMTVLTPSVAYVKVGDTSTLRDGEKKYANYLANQFSKHDISEVKSTEVITKLEGEYNFTDKRLPVWKVSYASNHNERFYVETATGKLSKRVDDREVYDGLIFNFLHKHHFMDFAGKGWRDFSTMFWVAAQIAMVMVGLILYFKVRKSKTRI